MKYLFIYHIYIYTYTVYISEHIYMVLYIVGLGLGDERDVTVKGLEAIRRCEVLHLEYYTSVLCAGM